MTVLSTHVSGVMSCWFKVNFYTEKYFHVDAK